MAGEEPIVQTVQSVLENVQGIVRSEVRLAGAEMKEKALEAGKAGAGLGAGAIAGLFGTGFLLVAVHKLLSRATRPWISALMIGGALQGVAAALVLGSLNEVRQLSPKPERAIEAAKETVEEVKRHAGGSPEFP